MRLKIISLTWFSRPQVLRQLLAKHHHIVVKMDRLAIGQAKLMKMYFSVIFFRLYDGMRMFSSQGGLSDPAVDTHILHELLKADIKSNDLISHYVSIDSINEI